MMLQDLEESSETENFQYDKKKILNAIVNFKNNDPFNRRETIFNVVAAECLRGNVFNEIGDIITICVRYNSGSTDDENSSNLNNIA